MNSLARNYRSDSDVEVDVTDPRRAMRIDDSSADLGALLLVKLHVHAGGGVRAFRAVSLLSGGIGAAIAFVGVLADHAIVIVRRMATVHPLIFCCVLIAIAIPVLRRVTVVHVVLRSFTSLRFDASGRILLLIRFHRAVLFATRRFFALGRPIALLGALALLGHRAPLLRLGVLARMAAHPVLVHLLSGVRRCALAGFAFWTVLRRSQSASGEKRQRGDAGHQGCLFVLHLVLSSLRPSFLQHR